MINLKELCKGVLEIPESASEALYPKIIVFQGQQYSRFMNIFYIDRPCDQLTTHQVHVLCRARINRPDSIGPINEKVRNIFRQAIFELAPTRALEIGAGRAPLMTASEALKKGIEYVISDGDEFNHNEIFSGEKAVLKYEAGTLDVVIALFVLHFRFFESQISEISRCLSENGVFLANVYRREQESRNILVSQMEQWGLKVKIVKDLHELCSAHEYWFIGKNDSNLNRVVENFYSKHFGN